MGMNDEPNKVTTVLKVVVTGEFYDDDATEETLRYAVEQYLEDSGFDVDVSTLKEQKVTLEKDGHHIHCLNCGEYWCNNDREGNPFPMNFCPNCGRAVKRQ